MTQSKPVEARRVKGFKDFLPAEAQQREAIKAVVRTEAWRAGFASIDTPALEYADVLLGASGEETDKEVYRFTDAGERLVAMRFDLTVGFARFVSENFGALPMPFKKFQIGEVWRGEKPQRGRYRQFCQADFDIVGSDAMAADVEVMLCIQTALQKILPQHTLTTVVSHRLLLTTILQHCLPKTAATHEAKLLIALDKREKIGDAAARAMLTEITGDSAGVDKLFTFLDLQNAGGNAGLEAVEKLLASPSAAAPLAAVRRFRETVDLLRSLTGGEKQSKYVIDLGLARGLGYYTGVVFETKIDALPGFGSISAGGRYDRLVARFGKHDLAGVGGSVGVDRLLAGMVELNLLTEHAGKKYFIAVAGSDAATYGYGFSLATQLRAAGVITDIAVKDGKLGAQFKYADRGKFSHVITVGESERQAQTFALKALATGQERRDIPAAQLISECSGK